MDKEQWIEIFTEINGRIPTEEEIQAGIRAGEITEILLNLHNLTLKQEIMKIYCKKLKMHKMSKGSVVTLFSVVHVEQGILLMIYDARIVKKF